MKIAYYMALGAFCALLNSGEAAATPSVPSLAQLHIGTVATHTYGQCAAGYYPSRYLDNIYGGPKCYKCVGGTKWNVETHKCS